VTQGAHGTVAINIAGSVTYTPQAGFSGPDSFVYRIVDTHEATATAFVFVTVSSQAAVGSMTVARYFHTTTRLADGRVLVAGGFDGTQATASAEVFDPASNSW